MRASPTWQPISMESVQSQGVDGQQTWTIILMGNAACTATLILFKLF